MRGSQPCHGPVEQCGGRAGTARYEETGVVSAGLFSCEALVLAAAVRTPSERCIVAEIQRFATSKLSRVLRLDGNHVERHEISLADDSDYAVKLGASRRKQIIEPRFEAEVTDSVLPPYLEGTFEHGRQPWKIGSPFRMRCDVFDDSLVQHDGPATVVAGGQATSATIERYDRSHPLHSHRSFGNDQRALQFGRSIDTVTFR
jgi:hypothetical protein